MHRIKLPVHDPAVSRDFYCRVLGFEEENSFHEDGVLMGVALIDPQSDVRHAVRREPGRAAVLHGFDPVALTVHTRAELEARVEHLDEQGLEHGPIMNGHIGWAVGFYDPDVIEVSLYTLERLESGYRSDVTDTVGRRNHAIAVREQAGVNGQVGTTCTQQTDQ